MAEIEFGSPISSELTKGTIHALAESIGKHLKYSPGDSLEPIVERLGGTIAYQDFWDLDSSTSGSICIQEEHKFTIYLPSHTGRLRDRFTIAHELGHYILHFLYPKQHGTHVGPIKAQRYGTGRVEWEANWFAAGFLMPETAFRNAFDAANGDVITVSEKFGVSIKAAQIRAQALGIGS